MANDMIGDVLVRGKQLDALMLAEWDTRFNRTMKVLKGAAGAGVSVEYPIGRVLKVGVGTNEALGTVAADTTLAAFVLLERVVLVAAGTYEVAVLERGPALINLDELVFDTGTAAPAQAAQIAALDLKGIKGVREPIVQSSGSLN